MIGLLKLNDTFSLCEWEGFLYTKIKKHSCHCSPTRLIIVNNWLPKFDHEKSHSTPVGVRNWKKFSHWLAGLAEKIFWAKLKGGQNSKLSDWHRLFFKCVENFVTKNFKMRLFSLKPITKKLKNKIKNNFLFLFYLFTFCYWFFFK